MIPNNATHLAISYEDIQKYLPESQIQNLQQILQSIELGRVTEGKPTNINYILIDCAELYIDKVKELINQEEKAKSTKEILTDDLVDSILNYIRKNSTKPTCAMKQQIEAENREDAIRNYEIRFFHNFVTGEIKYSVVELTYLFSDKGYRRQERRLVSTFDHDLAVRVRDLFVEEYNNSRRK